MRDIYSQNCQTIPPDFGYTPPSAASIAEIVIPFCFPLLATVRVRYQDFFHYTPPKLRLAKILIPPGGTVGQV